MINTFLRKVLERGWEKRSRKPVALRGAVTGKKVRVL